MANNARKLISAEGAQALRDFSKSMPMAINNIANSTAELMKVYSAEAERLGAHESEFKNMLDYVKKAQEAAVEAIEVLPKGLEETAIKIDDYLASTVTSLGK